MKEKNKLGIRSSSPPCMLHILPMPPLLIYSRFEYRTKSTDQVHIRYAIVPSPSLPVFHILQAQLLRHTILKHKQINVIDQPCCICRIKPCLLGNRGK